MMILQSIKNGWLEASPKKKAYVASAIIIVVGLVVAANLLTKYGYFQTGGHMFAQAMKNKVAPFLALQAKNLATVAKSSVAAWTTLACTAGGAALGVGSALYLKRKKPTVDLFAE
jgi:hypothetical protein